LALGARGGDAQVIANRTQIAKSKGHPKMLDPVMAAPLAVQLHIGFAILALCVGPFALFRVRRDRLHKVFGYIWVVGIVGLALTGLGIESTMPVLGPFGPIHLFSLFALWGVTHALLCIRKRDVVGHRASMQSVWFGAMGLAGIFTLLPGRVMNGVFLGDRPELGLWVVPIGVAVLIIRWRRWLRRVAAGAV
jgi:uncharacterized membrane protein